MRKFLVTHQLSQCYFKVDITNMSRSHQLMKEITGYHIQQSSRHIYKKNFITGKGMALILIARAKLD